MSAATSRLLRRLRWIGPMLLLLLILRLGPRELSGALAQAGAGWLLLGFALNLPQLGLKALRWWLIVRWQGLRLGYPHAVMAYFSALLAGFLTPGRLGEMAKSVTLKYVCNTSLARGLSSVVADRLFDMYLLLALGVAGLAHFSAVPPAGSAAPAAGISSPALVLVSILLIFPLFFFHERGVRRLGGWAVRLPLMNRRRDWILAKVDQFAGGLAPLTLSRVTVCVGLTLASYAIFFIQCQCCALALGFRLGWIELALMMAAANFVSFIPITVSGLGTREACLIYFLARVTPPQPAGVAVSLGLLIFVVLFVGGGFIGMLCWVWGPVVLRQAVHEVRREPGGGDGEVSRH